MNVGAAAVALAGLGVGTAALWFAWRLVRAAGGEGEPVDAAGRGTAGAQVAEESGGAPAAVEREPLADAPAAPTALGQIGAVLAFGGICLLLPLGARPRRRLQAPKNGFRFCASRLDSTPPRHQCQPKISPRPVRYPQHTLRQSLNRGSGSYTASNPNKGCFR